MGVLDKFLDVMKMNDEEDVENDDFFADDDVNMEEPKPKRSLFGLKQNKENDNMDSEPAEKSGPLRATRSRASIRPGQRKQNLGMEVRVIMPTSSEESRDIADALCSGSTVLLNLEGQDLEVSQRIIDFTSGALFAIDGNLQKVGNYIFLLTPSGVDVSGDISSVLGNQFSINSMNNNF